MARKRFHVLFQLDEGEEHKQESVLGNVSHLLDDLGEDRTVVELVCHGPGLTLLTGETGFAQQVATLVTRGVAMAACSNTMQARGVPRERLLPSVTIVSSGVGEIVRRQQEGWQYVRP